MTNFFKQETFNFEDNDGDPVGDVVNHIYAGMTQDDLREIAALRDEDFCAKHPNGFDPEFSPKGLTLSWLAFYSKTCGDECLIWPFATTEKGYAFQGRNVDQRLVHVRVCEEVHGPRPEGMHAAHTCGNASCVSPAHVRWCLPSENAEDKLEHGTAGIDRATIVKVFLAQGLHKEIAAECGVDRAVVSRIKSGETWAGVTSILPFIPEKKVFDVPAKARLGFDLVVKIFLAQGPQETTARLYGVSKGTVSNIKLGKSWAGLTSKLPLIPDRDDA